ncbi:MAG: TonB-dependent receptor [Prolixibacteraceae bacterium]|jgi:TonB-linked SusC/RagA family outer membrane protein
MKKKQFKIVSGFIAIWKSKLFLIMKLTVIALCFTVFQGFALATFGQNAKVNLKMTNVSIKQVLSLIEDQTNFFFIYNGKLVNVERKISVSAEDQDISDVLKEVFNGTNITYDIVNRQILLSSPEGNSGIVGQQQKSVSGRVTDSSGAPLPGVTVVIKGTTNGSITDIDGKFSLNNVADDAVLSFSFVGMKPQEIALEGKSVLNTTMIEDSLGIEEVVAIGYGTQKKETLTGSVVNISGADLKKSPAPNVTSSLSGKLPGLIVNQRSGEPGRDDPSILIRGNGTFDSNPDDGIDNNAPLIIIDGVERNNMSRLNPEDIASISVLKDASAAIYGARAANGVILVTTKRGAIGKPEFSFRYNSAFQSPTKIPEMLDAAAYAQVYNEAYWYRQGRPATNFTPFYSDAAIQKYRDGSDPILYPNTNWVKEGMKSYSMTNRTSIQVTGGSENVKYLLSFGSMTQNGIYKNSPSDYKQYNFRTNIDVTLSRDLSVGASINTIINQMDYSQVATWINFTNILVANPTLVARYPNGLIAPGRLGENPLLMDQRGYDKIRDTPLYSTFTASYKIPFIKGLSVDASFNYDLRNQMEKVYSKPYYYHEYNVNTQQYDYKKGTGASTVELTDTYSKWTTMLYNFKLVYNRTFDNHHVGAMIAQEQQKNTYSYVMAYRKNFVSPAIDQINVGSNASDDKSNGGSASETARNNYLGRFNYDFSSKYLIEFLFRYDGSQNFPSDTRYGFFPAGSLGWRLSEEPFVRAALPYVDQLKLRFSLGQIGNDRVSAYQYMQSYSFGNNYVFGATDQPGIYPNTMPNPNITWEVSTKGDLGLDASLWKGLLGVEFTLFKENRTNILAPRNLSIPSTLGFSSLPNENIGKVENHGFELKLSHRNTVKKLTYNLEGNVSFAKNEIVYMDETPQAEPYQNRTGHPVGASLFYKADGIFHTQEELDAYPHATGTQVGDVKILDLNDDEVINSKDQFRFDYTATPRVVFGLNASFKYSDFDMNLFFQGQTQAYNYDSQFVSLGNSNFDNAFADRAKDRWTVDNPNGTMPRADTYQPGSSTFFLYDATFVRLKSIELGYSLPKKVTSIIKMNDVRVYLSAFNLFTWAKDIKWSDPELSGYTLYYPQQRTINVGINVKF